MKSFKAIFRRGQNPKLEGDDLSRTSSVTNLEAEQRSSKGAKPRKFPSRDRIDKIVDCKKNEKKGLSKNNNKLDNTETQCVSLESTYEEDILQLKRQLQEMAQEKTNLALQLGEKNGQVNFLQKENYKLKSLQEECNLQLEKLSEDNTALRNRLRDVAHSPLSDNEKQQLLFESHRHHNSAPASIATNILDDGNGADTTCTTPDWDKHSSGNISEVSVACLQDKINQMQETHYSTNEELQATLQELTDLQMQLTELRQENERLNEEKTLMFDSLCRQTERLTDSRTELESLKQHLYQEKDRGDFEVAAEREQKLVELLKNVQEERESLAMRIDQLSGDLREVSEGAADKAERLEQSQERVGTLECTLDAKHAEHKLLDQELAQAKDQCSGKQIEINRLTDLLDNARTKIVELEQDRTLSDKSELDELLDNARKEKDSLESEVAHLKEQLAIGKNEIEKLKEQVSILQEECKVTRNNAKTTQSDLEYKCEKLLREKNALADQLQEFQEALNELQVQSQCQLEDKRQLSAVLSETQRNLSEAERKNLNLEHEYEELKKTRDEENEEWEKFQDDLLTSVRVANDFKTEAQQELQRLILENKSCRERERQLKAEIEKLKGSTVKKRELAIPVSSNMDAFIKRPSKNKDKLKKSKDSSGARSNSAKTQKIESDTLPKPSRKSLRQKRLKTLSVEEETLLKSLRSYNIDHNIPEANLTEEEKVIKKLNIIFEDDSLKVKPVAPKPKNQLAISKPLLDSVLSNPKLLEIIHDPKVKTIDDMAAFGQATPEVRSLIRDIDRTRAKSHDYGDSKRISLNGRSFSYSHVNQLENDSRLLYRTVEAEDLTQDMDLAAPSVVPSDSASNHRYSDFSLVVNKTNEQVSYATLERIARSIPVDAPDLLLTKEQKFAKKLLCALEEKKHTLRKTSRAKKLPISRPTLESVISNPKLKDILLDPEIEGVQRRNSDTHMPQRSLAALRQSKSYEDINFVFDANTISTDVQPSRISGSSSETFSSAEFNLDTGLTGPYNSQAFSTAQLKELSMLRHQEFDDSDTKQSNKAGIISSADQIGSTVMAATNVIEKPLPTSETNKIIFKIDLLQDKIRKATMKSDKASSKLNSNDPGLKNTDDCLSTSIGITRDTDSSRAHETGRTYTVTLVADSNIELENKKKASNNNKNTETEGRTAEQEIFETTHAKSSDSEHLELKPSINKLEDYFGAASGNDSSSLLGMKEAVARTQVVLDACLGNPRQHDNLTYNKTINKHKKIQLDSQVASGNMSSSSLKDVQNEDDKMTMFSDQASSAQNSGETFSQHDSLTYYETINKNHIKYRKDFQFADANVFTRQDVDDEKDGEHGVVTGNTILTGNEDGRELNDIYTGFSASLTKSFQTFDHPDSTTYNVIIDSHQENSRVSSENTSGNLDDVKDKIEDMVNNDSESVVLQNDGNTDEIFNITENPEQKEVENELDFTIQNEDCDEDTANTMNIQLDESNIDSARGYDFQTVLKENKYGVTPPLNYRRNYKDVVRQIKEQYIHKEDDDKSAESDPVDEDTDSSFGDFFKSTDVTKSDKVEMRKSASQIDEDMEYIFSNYLNTRISGIIKQSEPKRDLPSEITPIPKPRNINKLINPIAKDSKNDIVAEEAEHSAMAMNFGVENSLKKPQGVISKREESEERTTKEISRRLSEDIDVIAEITIGTSQSCIEKSKSNNFDPAKNKDTCNTFNTGNNELIYYISNIVDSSHEIDSGTEKAPMETLKDVEMDTNHGIPQNIHSNEIEKPDEIDLHKTYPINKSEVPGDLNEITMTTRTSSGPNVEDSVPESCDSEDSGPVEQQQKRLSNPEKVVDSAFVKELNTTPTEYEAVIEPIIANKGNEMTNLSLASNERPKVSTEETNFFDGNNPIAMKSTDPSHRTDDGAGIVETLKGVEMEDNQGIPSSSFPHLFKSNEIEIPPFNESEVSDEITMTTKIEAVVNRSSCATENSGLIDRQQKRLSYPGVIDFDKPSNLDTMPSKLTVMKPIEVSNKNKSSLDGEERLGLTTEEAKLVEKAKKQRCDRPLSEVNDDDLEFVKRMSLDYLSTSKKEEVEESRGTHEVRVVETSEDANKVAETTTAKQSRNNVEESASNDSGKGVYLSDQSGKISAESSSTALYNFHPNEAVGIDKFKESGGHKSFSSHQPEIPDDLQIFLSGIVTTTRTKAVGGRSKVSESLATEKSQTVVSNPEVKLSGAKRTSSLVKKSESAVPAGLNAGADEVVLRLKSLATPRRYSTRSEPKRDDRPLSGTKKVKSFAQHFEKLSVDSKKRHDPVSADSKPLILSHKDQVAKETVTVTDNSPVKDDRLTIGKMNENDKLFCVNEHDNLALEKSEFKVPGLHEVPPSEVPDANMELPKAEDEQASVVAKEVVSDKAPVNSRPSSAEHMQIDTEDQACGVSKPKQSLSSIEIAEKFEKLDLTRRSGNIDINGISESNASNLNLFDMETTSSCDESYLNLFKSPEEKMFDAFAKKKSRKGYLNVTYLGEISDGDSFDESEPPALETGSKPRIIDFVPLDEATQPVFAKGLSSYDTLERENAYQVLSTAASSAKSAPVLNKESRESKRSSFSDAKKVFEDLQAKVDTSTSKTKDESLNNSRVGGSSEGGFVRKSVDKFGNS